MICRLLHGLAVGIFLIVLLYFGCKYLMKQYFWQSGYLYKAEVERAGELQDYVTQNGLAATDSEELRAWAEERNIKEFTVSRKDVLLFDITYDGELYPGAKEVSALSWRYYFAVTFSDGEANVYLYEGAVSVYYNILLGISVIVGFAACLGVFISGMQEDVRYMDRLHRPKMSWGTLLLVGIVSLFSIALQWVLAENGSGSSALSDSVMQQHIAYIFLGYILMLLIYRLDYSVLAKYGIWVAAAILILLAVDCTFGLSINGSTMYISIGFFHLSAGFLSWLYIPVFGAVLYHYRGQGFECFWKILFWAVIPFGLIFKGTYLSRAILVYISLGLLMAAAIWKDWFHVPRKRGLLLAGSAFLLIPAGIAAVMVAIGNLPVGYYLTKLKNFFSPSATEAYHEAYSYTMGMVPPDPEIVPPDWAWER